MKLVGLILLLAISQIGCYDYSVESDDVTCDSDSGECIVCTNSNCSSTVTVTMPEKVQKPRDACDGNNTTNMLVGTCWTEQCIKGEKILVSKIAGVNCVFRPENAQNDEFVVGSCDDHGNCGN